MGLPDRSRAELGVRAAGWLRGGLGPIGERGRCEGSKSSLRRVGLRSSNPATLVG